MTLGIFGKRRPESGDNLASYLPVAAGLRGRRAAAGVADASDRRDARGVVAAADLVVESVVVFAARLRGGGGVRPTDGDNVLARRAGLHVLITIPLFVSARPRS